MQERQSPRSTSEMLVPAERGERALRRARRLHALAAAGGAALLALFALSATGCPEPGDLENPSYYCKPGQSVVMNGVVTGCTDTPAAGGMANTAGSSSGGMAAAGTPAGGSGSGMSCETACIKTLFKTDNMSCALCHSSTLKSAGLDLRSDGLAARLKNVPATHELVVAPNNVCGQGDLLVDATTPANSWLLKKVNGGQDKCGDPMPSGSTLPAADVTCIDTYVKCVAMGGT